MKIIVSGRNIQLTKAIKEYVTEKSHRLQQHYDFVKELQVFLSVEKNPSIHDNQRAEATVHVLGAVLRVKCVSPDLYGSIDKLIDKIDRALSKHKTKLLHRNIAGRHQEDSIRLTQVDTTYETDEADNTHEFEELFLIYQEDEVVAEATH